MNFSMSAGNAMLVPLVRERLGLDVAAVGLMSSAFSGGMLLGGVIIGWIGQVKRPTFALMAPLGGAGLAMMALSLVGQGQLALAVAAWGVVGMGVGMFNPQSGALYQRLVPDELRGRVMSVRITVAWGALPLGASLGSMVADLAGLPVMLVTFGLVIVGVATYAISSRLLRQLETEQRPAEAIARTAA
jgi:MFS family permease